MILFRMVVFAIFMVLPLLLSAQVNQTDEHGRKQGPWVKKHPNGKVRYQGQFLNDKPVGTFKYFNDQGKLTVVNEMYANGSRAKSTLYDEHGKKVGTGVYADQKKDSIWNYFLYDSILVAVEKYKMGVKDGVWTTYYETGKPAEIVTFKAGKQTGPFKQYFANGQLKLETVYLDGEIEGNYIQYHPNGKKLVEGVYKKSLKNGNWTSYTEEGKIEYKEKYDERGQLTEQILVNGLHVEYYSLLMPKFEINYVDGKKNGNFKEYYEGGEWKNRPAEGDETGLRYEKYLDGQPVKVVGKYWNDLYHGKIIWYKPDGTIEKTEYYDYGKKVEK